MKKNAELRRKLLPLLIAGCFGAGQALANPFGAQVVNGQVAIASQGNVLTVTNSPGAIINWQGFSIGAGELTKFVQQGASSTVLNRIIGQDPSQILGALQSNGRVLLINPNGILFGQGAQVNVGGLVASTLNISNDDFLAGRMKFQAGDKAANLQNQGSITSAAGGQIYLIAPNVENSGLLTSPKGEVVLAAGRSVHLVDGANPDLHVVVSAPDNQAINLGQVVAESGNVGIYGALIKQRGLVSANSAVVGENGKIVFKASKDALLEAGSQTTATGAGTGGTIHVLGERVGLTGNAKVDASGQTGGGTVLVGGDYQGKNAAVENARQTYFGKDAEIRADALVQGDGGKVILWADDATRAYGSISARGGQLGGNGGFVETSGKQNLAFDARIDTRAPMGKSGTVLLDPDTLNIVNGGGATHDDAVNPDGVIFDVDGGAGTTYVVSEIALESILATTDVILQATGQITVYDLLDNILDFKQGTGRSVLIQSTGGSIVFEKPEDSLVTSGGNITLSAGGSGNINVGNVFSNGGAISMAAGGNLSVGQVSSSNGSSAGNVNLTSGGLMTLGVNSGINANATTSGDVTLTAGAGINHYGAISSNGGKIQLTVTNSEATLYTATASQIVSPGGQIELIADKMNLGGLIDASGGKVWLMPKSSIAIDVGTVATNYKTATLELANSELNLIRASKLVIGDGTSTGALTIKSGMFGGTGGALEKITGVLSFNTAGSITQDAGATIAAPAVEAIGSAVNLMEANGTGVISGAATGGDFQYHTINLLTMSQGHLRSGITVPLDKTIRLQSDSLLGINQAGGSPLKGGQLVMQTPGPVYLADPGNSIAKIAADLYVGGAGTGSFGFLNSTSLAVDGPFYGITGITTNNKNVEISVPVGYTIVENKPIVMGSGSKSLNSNGFLTGSSTTSSIATGTTSTATATLPQSVEQILKLNSVVTNSTTNIIVSANSTVAPDPVTKTQDTKQDKDQKKESSKDAIFKEEPNGASKNEFAKKLYCN